MSQDSTSTSRAGAAEEWYVGTVKSYAAAQGYGFIECAETFEEFKRDIFLHRSEVEEGDLGRAKPGLAVRFTVELNSKGHPQARLVEKSGQARAAQPPAATSSEVFVGRVKNFSPTQGYGFISCNTTWGRYQKDVFLHRMQAAQANVMVGDPVKFTVQLKDGGKPQARDLQKISAEDLARAQEADEVGQLSFGELFQKRRAAVAEEPPAQPDVDSEVDEEYEEEEEEFEDEEDDDMLLMMSSPSELKPGRPLDGKGPAVAAKKGTEPAGA